MLSKKLFLSCVILSLLLSFGLTSFADEGDHNGEGDNQGTVTQEEMNSLFGIAPELSMTPAKPAVTEISSIEDTETLFRRVFNFALSFVGIIAMIMIVMAGYYYITAYGEEGQIEKAKKILITAIAGIIIIIASYTIVATVLRIGPGSQGTWQEFFKGFF